MEINDFQEENSVADELNPPDRTSSASAPPALELATESLFAWTVQYANIFSDIRANEDYYKYYEAHRQEKKLPPPLDPAPFLFNEPSPEEFIDDNLNGKFKALHNGKIHSPTPYTSHESLLMEARQNLQMQLFGQQNGHDMSHIPGPSQSIWTPLPRKFPAPMDYNGEDLVSRLAGLQTEGLSEMQQLNLSESTFGSSPSAQTAFKSAQYVWNDDDEPQQPVHVQQIFPPLQRHENGSPTKHAEKPLDLHALGKSQDSDSKSPPSDDLSPRSNVICRYYAGGYCSRGDKCFYSHDSESQEKVKQDTKQQMKTPTKTKGGARGANGTSTKHNTAANGNGALGNAATVTSPRAPTSTQKSQSDDADYYTTFDQLIGKVYLVSRDQQGCRFLQKKLEEEDPKTVEIIFNEVYDHITELMTDPFGNYLCQKLLEHCNDEQRLKIVESVSPELVPISKNMHGTRAVQKMIECLSSPAQVQLIVRVLSGSVVELIQDLNGNHVIQRCLNRLTPKDNQFIYDAVTSGNNCVQVATHRHGCCVLQRCIDHGSDKQKVQLIQEITKNALTLVQDPYGNYVVQYVLELPFPELVDSLARGFIGNVKHLATQKFSSNVIEKCLSLASAETSSIMIREMLEADNLLAMLSDPFANYVVQTALSVSDQQLHNELVDAIRPHLAQLRNTPYGKRIQQSKISKETADRAAGHHKSSKKR